MARSRNIKPGFFTNEDLVELDFATRLLFAGLWTVADREGRLQDRPKKIKIDLFPADNLDIDVMLQELHDAKFIVRYEVNGAKYVQIATWSKHQNPHHTEKASEIPDANGEVTVKETLKPKEAQTIDGGNLADSLLLIPDSLIPDSKGETRKRVHAPSRPDDISETVWQDFLAIRKAKRAPLTDTAMDGIKREASKAGITLPEAVTACCEFGWAGFNASWYAERTTAKPAGNRFPDKNAIPAVSDIWHESAAGVAQKAAEMGLPTQGDMESHPAFKSRVVAAAGRRPSLNLGQLAAMAEKRMAA